jgi:transcriptional regulator with XRE-family HTH domain
MDAVRLGRGVRALRRRRGWRQADLAAAAHVSQSLISRIEIGRSDRVTLRSLQGIAAALGARIVARLDYNGEALDRLLDADHAALVEATVGRLVAAGWSCTTEVTFAIDGERGSVDVLAHHAPTGCLLVVEAKSVIPDLQATLATLDRKARLGSRIAGQVGWRSAGVGRLLVVAESRTTRRRVAEHRATFEVHLPDRAAEIRRALASPRSAHPIRGLLFLPLTTHPSARHRVSRATRRRRAWTSGPTRESAAR